MNILLLFYNSLCPADAICQHILRSVLTQLMACNLRAPSHYLNQCWPFTREALRYSPESKFPANVQATILYNGFENYDFEINTTVSRGEWVNPASTVTH